MPAYPDPTVPFKVNLEHRGCMHAPSACQHALYQEECLLARELARILSSIGPFCCSVMLLMWAKVSSRTDLEPTACMAMLGR